MKDSLMRSAGRPHRHTPAPVAAGSDLSLHFEGLANPTRLKIVERLAATAEVRVSELAEQCKVSQPRMSWHLRMLKRALVIRTRRDGREVLCRLDRDSIRSHLERFAELLETAQPPASDRIFGATPREALTTTGRGRT